MPEGVRGSTGSGKSQGLLVFREGLGGLVQPAGPFGFSGPYSMQPAERSCYMSGACLLRREVRLKRLGGFFASSTA
jgi:hypothetical protein